MAVSDNVHAGHRKRLRQRFINDGNLSNFQSHEVLELLLFYALPRRDTNALAHKVINKYGSLSQLFEVPAEELIKNKDLSENAAVLLSLIKQVAKDYISGSNEGGLKIKSKNDAASIVEPMLAHRRNETFCIICMDINQNVTDIECFEEGEPGYTDIDVDKILAKVVEQKAAFAIIAHNHPNGTYSPSSEDIATTNVIKKALSLANVTLIDHLIVCGNKSYSLAQNRMCNLRY